MALKDNLKRIRQLKGIKVAHIVKQTGVTKESYYAYERGQYKPSEETLNKLAKLFGIEVKEFYEEKPTYVDLPTKKEDPDERIRILIKNLDRMGELNEYLLKELKRLQGG